MSAINSLLAQYQTKKTDLSTLMANDYLPYITIGAGTSGAVAMGVAGVGDLILTTAGNPTKLGAKGTKVNAILCLSQAKAMDTSGESLRVVYDETSAEYNEIVAKAQIKDSGAMYGAEYLVYLPDNDKFVAFHLASKTARKMTPVFESLLGKSVQLSSKLIETKKYKWFGPFVEESVTPHKLFTAEALAIAVGKFTPKAGEAPATTSNDAGRAR